MQQLLRTIQMRSNYLLLKSSKNKILRKLRAQQQRDIKTLTINAGSSSLKYSLYDVERAPSSTSLQVNQLASGMVDRVGEKDASITHNKKVKLQNTLIPNHVAGLEQLLKILQQEHNLTKSEIECIGHRVVHGGPNFSSPTIITPEVRNEIDSLSSYAPLHNPAAISGIDATLSQFPNATQVAIFDTAFHATMPPSSYRYAIPNEWYEEYGIRKFGFHGTSYQYVAQCASDYINKPLKECNFIILHLGSGASMCCIENGKSIDTTMGFTPLEGLVMSTRSGDVDAGIYDLLSKNGLSSGEISTMLNKQSGLKGIMAGKTNDMRKIAKYAQEGNANAQLARQLFVERCRKYLGAYLVKLNGKVDAICFTGGIGEDDIATREAICANLEEMNIILDKGRNSTAQVGGGSSNIQKLHVPFSHTKLLAIPTNEELSIAMQASELALPQLQEEELKTKGLSKTTAKTAVSRNLFCHSLGHTYTASVEVGLLSVFSGIVERVGYFEPIHRPSYCFRTFLMKEAFNLPEDEEEMYGVTQEEWMDLVAKGKDDELFEKVLSKYTAYASKKDFVLVSSATNEDDQLQWGAKLCSALSLPAVFLTDAVQEHALGLARAAFNEHSAETLGVIVHDVPCDKIEEEKERVRGLGVNPVAILPRKHALHQRTMSELMDILDDSVCLYGSEHLQRPIDSIRIYTMHVDDLMQNIKENELAIVYHNRTDTLFALLLAAQSSGAPRPAGILFTYHKSGELNTKVASLLDGISDIRIPVVACSDDTIVAADKILKSPVFVTPESEAKIEACRILMESNLDASFIQDNFAIDEEHAADAHLKDIGPRMFQFSMSVKAREAKKTIVLPEGADERVVKAASILTQRKLCKVLLVGDSKTIHEHADKLRCSIDDVEIIEPESYVQLDDMVNELVQVRKHKGMTPENAKALLLQDVNYFGTMLMHMNKAHGMVSGACHSSANTIRPALQILKTSPGSSIVSSIFFMLLEDGVKVFGDCAINVNPNAKELAEIATASAKTAKQFGISPRVALLSYATGDSNKGELITKVRDATTEARNVVEREGWMEKFLIEGPLQFDAAVDPAVASHKMKDNPVAGNANVLIFPDLNSGNNGYKAVQQASKTIAVGPILQGLKKPVNDLSRGATVDDIVNTAIITALQTTSPEP